MKSVTFSELRNNAKNTSTPLSGRDRGSIQAWQAGRDSHSGGYRARTRRPKHRHCGSRVSLAEAILKERRESGR